MKIALVIERFAPARGGRETSTAQIAEELARRGQDVTVFCMSADAGGRNFRVQELKSRGLDRTTRLGSFARSVRGMARDGGFDIIHATLPVPSANVFQPRGGLVGAQEAAALRRRRGWRRILKQLTQPLSAHRRKMRSMERRLVRKGSTVCLAVSEMVAREFVSQYAREDNVRVVYNAVALPEVSDEQRAAWRKQRRELAGASTAGPVFLTVATNFRLKGVAEAIEAFARWRESQPDARGARLVAVGQRKYNSYRRLARKLGVRKQVYFEPHADNIWPWYAAADVCVLLSWYDPCSRVVLEATRWGIPSITTAFNGAAEALCDGAGMVVSSPADIAATTRAMGELAEPARRAACRQACQAVADRLSVARHVDELMDVYQEVAART